jgi:hypothetical protein
MKFFISGQIEDAPNVRHQMNLVEAAGHHITHDWTATDTFLGGREAKLQNRTETGQRAAKDIQGVIESDVYVLSSDNDAPGKGMYVELGAALALHEATGKPAVYVIGKMNHLSVFYLHPAVVHLPTIHDVLKAVKVSSK